MPKQLRDYPIYIAPQIRGQIQSNGEPRVFDEKTNTYLNPDNVNDKITIYERQVNEWFLKRASNLLKGKNNDFIVLMIAISYIEGIEEYRRGSPSNNQSKEYFRTSLRRIYNLTVDDLILNDFFDQVRCGLFHSGMTRNKVIINNDYENTIDFSEDNAIKINPKKFLHKIQEDFDQYIRILRNTNNMIERNRFSTMFNNLQN
ncbi:MAG: hypothetical protein ABIF85_02595 [Nanoarchaeota archaeon]